MFRLCAAAPLIVLSLVSLQTPAQKSIWTIDKNQTQVSFAIRRVPVSTVRGSFSGITGTVVWDEKDITKSRVRVTIPTASVSTNNGVRDAGLRSANFFDVQKYPTMTFESTSVTGSSGHLSVTGNLTLAGTTKPVTLSVDGPTPPTKMGKVIIGFSATGTLKRSEFDFAPKYPAVVLGDEIEFTIDAEANQ